MDKPLDQDLDPKIAERIDERVDERFDERIEELLVRGIEPIAVKAKRLAPLLGLCEHKVRDLTRELPHVRLHGSVLFPLDEVRRWFSDKARRR